MLAPLSGGAGSDRAIGRRFTSNPAPFLCSRIYIAFTLCRLALLLQPIRAARNALVNAEEDHNELVLYPEMEIH
jgi:hypothetical protein